MNVFPVQIKIISHFCFINVLNKYRSVDSRKALLDVISNMFVSQKILQLVYRQHISNKVAANYFFYVSGLIQKNLRYFGIGGVALDWFQSYLSGRIYCVHVVNVSPSRLCSRTYAVSNDTSPTADIWKHGLKYHGLKYHRRRY